MYRMSMVTLRSLTKSWRSSHSLLLVVRCSYKNRMPLPLMGYGILVKEINNTVISGRKI